MTNKTIVIYHLFIYIITTGADEEPLRAARLPGAARAAQKMRGAEVAAAAIPETPNRGSKREP